MSKYRKTHCTRCDRVLYRSQGRPGMCGKCAAQHRNHGDDPTPDEIRAHCLEIQKEWSSLEQCRRIANDHDKPKSVEIRTIKTILGIPQCD